MIEKAMPSIVHTPAASPSTPSEKLTTFISPTSQMTVSTPPVFGNCEPADEWQRHVGHHRAGLDRDHRGRDLPEQLDQRAQVARVIDRADERDQHGRQHNRQVCTVPPGPWSPRAVWASVIGSASRSRRRPAPRRGSPGRPAVASPVAPARVHAATSTAPIRRASRAASGVNAVATPSRRRRRARRPSRACAGEAWQPGPTVPGAIWRYAAACGSVLRPASARASAWPPPAGVRVQSCR